MKKAEKTSVREEKKQEEGQRGTINKGKPVEKYIMGKLKCL